MTRRYLLLLLGFISCQAMAVESPNPSRQSICISFECDQTAQVALSADDWRQIRGFFQQLASPQQERERIARYIAFMETLSGRQTPTWRDRGENDPNVDPLGQLDCIAESTNTTTYLKLLQSSGLLRYHRVGERQVRHSWWVYPHWTAVVIDRQSGEAYAVDSWFRPNGQPPFILPLRAWLDGMGAPEG